MKTAKASKPKLEPNRINPIITKSGENSKGGRPSKYRPEYCSQLIIHMAKGLSFESFGAAVGVNQDTLHEWAKVHTPFSEAKKEAWSQNLLFWEEIGIKGMTGKIPGFNATIWIFNLKNRFKWRDVHHATEAEGMNESQKALDEALARLNKNRNS